MGAGERKLKQEENALILKLHVEGVSAEKIARRMGRAESTVLKYIKIARESGAISTTPQRLPWSKEEDQLLVAMKERGATHEEIAKKLGRTKNSVRARGSYLGITQSRNTHPPATLCWRCNRNAANCPWLRKYKAVKGWKAKRMPYSHTYSYMVYECPLFEQIERMVVDDDEEDLL